MGQHWPVEGLVTIVLSVYLYRQTSVPKNYDHLSIEYENNKRTSAVKLMNEVQQTATDTVNNIIK